LTVAVAITISSQLHALQKDVWGAGQPNALVLECHSKERSAISKPIDLRTEVVTRPTPAMWQVMQDAEIGWAQKGEDPYVNRLEKLAAELTGKEASLFVFTASLANLLALVVGTNKGDHAIFEADMHMVWIEGWNLSYICGLYPRLVPSERGEMPLPEVEKALTDWRGPAHPRPSLIAVENPHNDHGGTIVSAAYIAELAALAHAHGARLHMDGARLHNVAVATRRPLIDYTRHLDTVTVSVNKGLGVPVGALLCGSTGDIETARTRGLRWLGAAGMHRGGIFAAAALYSLENMVSRLAEDHRRARILADGIRDLPGIEVNRPETNLVKVSTATGGRPAVDFVTALEAQGLLTTLREPHVFKLMTHHEIDDRDIQNSIGVLHQVAGALVAGGVGAGSR
jgi:threonine aldolase